MGNSRSANADGTGRASNDFTVSLHWSRRFEADPGNQWLHQTIVALFSETPDGQAARF